MPPLPPLPGRGQRQIGITRRGGAPRPSAAATIRQAATPRFLNLTERLEARQIPLGRTTPGQNLPQLSPTTGTCLSPEQFASLRGSGVGEGDGGGPGPAPAPWQVNLSFPESPFRSFFQQNVPWYNPLSSLREGQVAGLSPEIANQLLVLNALLPFLGPEDVSSMSRFLAMATGGSAGPFAGYLQAPPVASPVRQQVGERRRLEDALAVARLLSTPGERSLSEGILGLGLSGLGAGARPDGGLGPQDIVARSRSGQSRFLSELEALTGAGGPGASIAPFLNVLARPSALRPTPGQLVRGPGGGFDVNLNPAFLTG